MSCEILNLSAIKEAAVVPDPFPYTLISNSIVQNHFEKLHKDFPQIKDAGSFPLDTVHVGSYFSKLVDELKSSAFRQVIAEKFNIDLQDKPVMITVRGKADRTDGRIHTDSKSKLITVLLYMNEDWQPDGGRLRLLRDNHNLNNYFAEISPSAGNMLIFKVTENGWHGHKTFIGTRKVIQLNYVTNETALNKHATRHRISAKFKEWRRKILGK